MIARLDRARRLAPRGAALGEPPRLAALARGDLPGQQPRARRDGVRRLLGHVLAADRRGADRHAARARPAVVRPLHGAAGARARAAERDRAGDRVAPGDGRQRAAQLPRCRPSLALGARRRARRVRRRRRGRSRWRCSSVGGVRRRQRRAGVLARRRRAPRDDRRGAARARCARSCAQPPALRRLPRARRHGACCSSASPRRRRSTTRATCA